MSVEMTHKSIFLSGAPGDSGSVSEEAGTAAARGAVLAAWAPGLQLLPRGTHADLRPQACLSHCSVLWVLLRCGWVPASQGHTPRLCGPHRAADRSQTENGFLEQQKENKQTSGLTLVVCLSHGSLLGTSLLGRRRVW